MPFRKSKEQHPGTRKADPQPRHRKTPRLHTKTPRTISAHVRLRIRDPYLADAIEEYDRVFEDMKRTVDVEHVEENIYLLCELSRDMTIRLLPFSKEMEKVIAAAKTKFEQTLKLLAEKPKNANIRKYVENIRRRIGEYCYFLENKNASFE